MTIAEPRFALPLKSIVILHGRELIIERKIGERWQFLDIEDESPVFKTDREIAQLQVKGLFFVQPTDSHGRKVRLPPSPIIAKANDENNSRKYQYVKACLDAPGGFRISRPVLEPIIATIAEARKESPTPGFTTVLTWIEGYQLLSDTCGLYCFTDRHDLKGRYGHRGPSHWEKAIESGIERWLHPGITKQLAYSRVCRFVRLYDLKFGRLINKSGLSCDLVDENNRLRPPSLRTFQRRCKEVDPAVRDAARKGLRYAQQKYRTYTTNALPDRPYAQVEVDHCTLDIQLIDPTGLILGRPDLIIFRDRATAMILGYGLGYEAPSYASFFTGLRHAFYPKDLSPFPAISKPWPCYGRIQNLFVDNALHLIGDNIQEAGRQLKFNVEPLQPRQPWLKGALERFFRSLNSGLVHTLPGAIRENLIVRREYDKLAEATLTVDEFESLLTFWICQIYHAERRKALGPIRGFGGVPLTVWEEKVKTFTTPQLPTPEQFDALAGDWELRTIQKDGIAWDYIKYEDANLSRILTNPNHKVRSDGGTVTKYKVVRNPWNLGQIHVENHHTGELLQVPATTGHRFYAEGRTLHQHNVTKGYAARRIKAAIDFDSLVRAKDQLAEIATTILNHPKRKQIERKLARYFAGDRARRPRSEIAVVRSPGGGRLLDLTPQVSASIVPPSSFVPASAAEITPTPAETTASWPAPDDPAPDDDLAALRSKKNWESGYE